MQEQKTSPDILDVILEDHREVRDLLAGFGSSPAEQWSKRFRELVNVLVRHEVAEEEVVLPVIRKRGGEWAALADTLISEQANAERRLDKMERLDPGSVEFADEMQILKDDVERHARHEEQSLLRPLSELAEPDRVRLAARYRRAMSIAPTHPHPQAPDKPPGNVLLGPIAALADRMRDALRQEEP